MCHPPNANSPADTASSSPRGPKPSGAPCASSAPGTAPGVSSQPSRDDEDHRQDLHAGDGGLHAAAGARADVVDGRQREDRADGHHACAGVAERHERTGVAREHRRNRGDDAAVHAPEHRPAPEEPEGGRVDLAEEDVDAAGLRVRRRQLGADERAEQRQPACQEPREHDAARRGHQRGDLRRLNEDRGADDGADDERRRVRQPDDAREAVQSGLSGNIIVRHMWAVGLLSLPRPSLGCLKCLPMMSWNGSIETLAFGSNA